MPSLTNSPAGTLSFQLERRKSYTFTVNLVNGDSSVVDLTNCTLRFVVKTVEFDNDHFDSNNIVVNSLAAIPDPTLGAGVFSLQAAELDGEPGEYHYALVIWTADGYSSVLAKGIFELLPNAESGSMHSVYSNVTPAAEVELALRSGATVSLAVNTLNEGARGEQGEQGAPGRKGDKGDKGDTGPAGPSGPMGVVQAWAGLATNVPVNYLLCDGSAYSPTAYPELFALIGTMYGGTAAAPLLPDLRNRVPVGQGANFAHADTGGAKTVSLTTTQLAAHQHGMSHTHAIDPPVTATSTVADHQHGPGTLAGYYSLRSDDDSGTAAKGSLEYTYSAFNKFTSPVVINSGLTAAAGAHSHTVDIASFISGAASATLTGSTGNGAAHENMPPYLVLNYIIKAA